MDLTSKTLMEFASISEGNYNVEIHKGENIISKIDYMDGTTLENNNHLRLFLYLQSHLRRLTLRCL